MKAKSVKKAQAKAGKKKINLCLPLDLIEAIGHRAISDGYGHRPSLVVEDACRKHLRLAQA